MKFIVDVIVIEGSETPEKVYSYEGYERDNYAKEILPILEKLPEAVSIKIGNSGTTHVINLKKIKS